MSDGYVDIGFDEIKKYFTEALTKTGICDVIPGGRFRMTTDGLEYSGLICRVRDMGGKSVGISASPCVNCLKRRRQIDDTGER